MRCPHCHSTVEPQRGPTGALLCPACSNTGQVVAAAAPGAPAPAPAAAAWSTAPGPARAEPPGMATGALVVGIASVVVFPLAILLGPVAIVLAVKALRKAKLLPGNPGQGMAITGLVLGILGIMVGITVVMAAVVFVLVSNLGDSEQWAFEVNASGPGGILTVTGYPGFPSWDEFVLGGTAACRLPEGDVGYGDDILCTTDGTFVLHDADTNEIVYETTV